jgi:hypothetical protein
LAAEHEEAGRTVLPIEVLTEAVVDLLTMPRVLRDIVCWRFAGLRYRDIGAALGLSRKAVEHRHVRAMDEWPSLKGLFALKLVKRGRRRKKGGVGWMGRRGPVNSGAKHD